jgi:opacity protein-like surface antigen
MSQSLFGQTTETKINRFSFGFNFSPNVNYRSLVNNDNSATSSNIITSRNQYEKPMFGYTTDFGICYKISDRWAIETGIQFSNEGYGYEFKPNEFTFGNQISQWGFTQNISQIGLPISQRNNSYYLGIPLKIRLQLGSGKINFTSSLGFTTNYLIKSTTSTTYELANGDHQNEILNDPADYNAIHIAPTISAGIGYKLNDHIYLRAEPNFQYGLLKIIDAPVSANWWHTGVNIGCYYRFD